MTQENNGFDYKDGVTLKEFFEQKFHLYDRANILAREGMEKRLDGMNEIREQLRTQKSEFVTRVEHDGLVKDIQDLREFRATLQGKASMTSVYISYLLAGIAIIISVLNLAHK